MKQVDWFQIVSDGDLPEVQQMIASGQDINAKDEEGFTALMLAVMDEQFELTKLLLASGADVNVVDSDGDTPLISAVMSRNTTILQVLLEHGADVKATNSSGGNALMFACIEGKKEVVDLLIDYGADVNAVSEGFISGTPLMVGQCCLTIIRRQDAASTRRGCQSDRCQWRDSINGGQQ